MQFFVPQIHLDQRVLLREQLRLLKIKVLTLYGIENKNSSWKIWKLKNNIITPILKNIQKAHLGIAANMQLSQLIILRMLV